MIEVKKHKNNVRNGNFDIMIPRTDPRPLSASFSASGDKAVRVNKSFIATSDNTYRQTAARKETLK